MPVILLIRHGENDYVKKQRLAGRMAGVHLNQNGQKQAQALAETLGRAPIKAIYSSPLERAMETAAPLAQALGLPVQPRPGLIEVRSEPNGAAALRTTLESPLAAGSGCQRRRSPSASGSRRATGFSWWSAW